NEAVVEPSVGGPNQPNQVYIDLSTTEQTAVKRDSWDLGFATGDKFRVIINGSIKMAVKQLETTDIDQVQESDATVAVGYSTMSSLGYVDDPTGTLEGAGGGEGTAIAEISANDTDNKVYLVNLGYEVGTTTPDVGSVALDGDARGWKKIRITRNGSGYTLHYADIDATTHQTVNISKDSNFNFTFFSFDTDSVVNVQPQKDKWDLNFSGFTNYYPFAGGVITYYFADFITTNVHGGTQVYAVLLEGEDLNDAFTSFTAEDVVDTNFWTSVADQRVIGDTWRVGGGPGTLPSIKDDRFYVVKDAAGNLYKLVFRALTNDAGERGFPVFEYELL
ncbi:MAG: HmuY family protein, partial [Weeksellaceae bacterium]|nr:HmuY family protein [Weeksellaceae bacterium]